MRDEIRLFDQSILINHPNFRDVGGFKTADGKIVKSGVLYRSGSMSDLTRDEMDKLISLGIQMIIDFRSDSEVIQYPTPSIPSTQKIKRIPIVDSARGRAEQMMKAGDALGLSTLLVHDYRRMVKDHQDDLREFFRELATTKHLPLIYHCAAGKDRTGLSTYLLLLALGVSEKDARADYLKSNELLKPTADRIILEVQQAGNPNSEIIRPLMEVRESYLDAAIDEILHQYGSVDAFLVHGLKIEAGLLRERFLRTA